jgi:polysaccharide pyruvyl transferase WcaK-like protein
MKFFVAGMVSCGNLGDDLLSKVLVDRITLQYPNSEIGILVGEEINSLNYLHPEQVQKFLLPRKNNPKEYFERRQKIKNFIQESDVFIVGGGGLMQDTHFFFNIHRWLKYRYDKRKIRTFLLGIGIGPIRFKISSLYMKELLKDFNLLQVRDIHSQHQLGALGFKSEVFPDIVNGTKPYYLSESKKKEDSKKNVLGCSIRPWNDLSLEKTASLINKIVLSKEVSEVVFFVFENSTLDHEEEEYAKRLSKILEERSVKTRIFTYNKDSVELFFNSFAGVTLALASRFHANILWQKLQIPTIPISYAPKVKSLFREFGGEAYEAKDLYSVENISDCFQLISFDKDYNLPNFEHFQGESFSNFNFVLVKMVSVMDFVMSSSYSLVLRFKKILKW